MMTKEEIEKEANEYTEQFLPHVDTTGHWLGYIAGRTKGEEERWISVKEKLPDVGVLIMAWRRELTKAKRVKIGETYLWHFDGEYHYTYEEPTHWMPLPEPPKE